MPTYHTGPGGVWVQDPDQPADRQYPVSGAGIGPSSSERIYKPIGNTITPGSVTSQTLQIKAAIPADADAVGAIFFHHDTSNALTGVRACVAATEIFYGSTSDELRHPFANGAAVKTLDDAGSLYGWRSATWGGAASPTLAAPAAVGGTAGLSNVPTSAVMDMVPLPPLPISATDIAGGGDPAFRYVMLRFYIPGSAGNKYAFSAFTHSVVKSAINAGWVTRFGQSGGDVVTTAINTTCGDSPSLSLPVAIVYRSKSRGRGFLFCGDSITQGQGSTVTDEQMQPYVMRACNRFTAGKWSPINIGCSSQTQATFLAAAQSAIPALKPAVAMFQAGSVNDGAWATLLAMQQYTIAAMGRVQTFLALCAANSVQPVLATWIPVPAASIASSALGLTIDAERRAFNARIRAIGAAGGAMIFDADALLTDNGTVDAFGVRRIAASLTPDGTHPNEAGSKVLDLGLYTQVLSRLP